MKAATKKKEEDIQTKKFALLDKYVNQEDVKKVLDPSKMDINLADAQSKAGGISGTIQRIWRPLIGFSCALAIFWEFVLKQFLMFLIATMNWETKPLPELDMATLMPLVMALLGMGALRS